MGPIFRLVTEGALLVFAALLPIVNPLGGAPVFLAMTADCSPSAARGDGHARRRQRVRAAAGLGVRSAPTCSTFFGLSMPIVQVGGGLVVCAAGWDLLRASDDARPRAAPPAGGSRHRQPRVLSADAAADRRPRLDLGRDHARREPPGERAHAAGDRAGEPRRRDADRGDDLRVLPLRRPDRCSASGRPAPASWSGCRRSSCCASACRSSGAGSRRCSGRCRCARALIGAARDRPCVARRLRNQTASVGLEMRRRHGYN